VVGGLRWPKTRRHAGGSEWEQHKRTRGAGADELTAAAMQTRITNPKIQSWEHLTYASEAYPDARVSAQGAGGEPREIPLQGGTDDLIKKRNSKKLSRNAVRGSRL